MSARIKLPSYASPIGLRYDPQSDSYYVLRSPPPTNGDIADKMSRKTESYLNKLYPWQKNLLEKDKWMRVMVISKNPAFDSVVSKQEAEEIAERLSRPTKAMLLRQKSQHEISKAPSRDTSFITSMLRFSATLGERSKSLPRLSARPEKSILLDSGRKRKKEEEDAGNSDRAVHFQSPLPSRDSDRPRSKQTPQEKSTPPKQTASKRGNSVEVSTPEKTSKANKAPPSSDNKKYPRNKVEHAKDVSEAKVSDHSRDNKTRKPHQKALKSNHNTRSDEKQALTDLNMSSKTMEEILDFFSDLPDDD